MHGLSNYAAVRRKQFLTFVVITLCWRASQVVISIFSLYTVCRNYEEGLMKVLLGLVVLFSSVSALSSTNQPVSVSVPLRGIFSIDGFDDNDRVQINVQGTLPTTCFKVAKSEAKVDVTRHIIRLNEQAFLYQGSCLRIPTTYHDVINVGIVEAGKYTVVDDHSGKTLGEISIAKSNRPEADDFLYAAVGDAYLSHDEGGSAVVLTGEFSDSCTSFQDAKFSYTKDSIIVQPIVERSGENCQAGTFTFRKQFALPSLTGQYLLHVRSMNGQAINKLVTLR